ncbi:MAG: oligopeptide/dipeptide ABC transporter ATP-binding protein [Parachlamydiaceae bacterium]
MDDPLLRVRGLKKHFPVREGLFRKVVGQVYALDGVDFDLGSGEILGIVGETGCGKSTLGRTVLRLLEPTSGEVLFDGHDLLTFDKHQLKHFRKEAQIIFQDPLASLNPRKTVRESIGEGLFFHGLVKTAAEQKDYVADILLQVGLSPDVMYRYPHQFSGGQQQRICIGRALALKPRLIVCDEALSALDVSIQAQILNLLQDLKERFSLSYLFISHDLATVEYLCDRIVVLYLGKVMEKASTEDLFNNPCHPYTQALLSAIPKKHPDEIRNRLRLQGEIPSAIHPPSGCRFRTRCPYAQPICCEIPPCCSVSGKTNQGNDHEYHCILGTVPRAER